MLFYDVIITRYMTKTLISKNIFWYFCSFLWTQIHAKFHGYIFCNSSDRKTSIFNFNCDDTIKGMSKLLKHKNLKSKAKVFKTVFGLEDIKFKFFVLEKIVLKTLQTLKNSIFWYLSMLICKNLIFLAFYFKWMHVNVPTMQEPPRIWHFFWIERSGL